MKLKRLISLVLSAGILSSSILSSGAPLSAMIPSQKWNLEDWVNTNLRKSARLCLSKDVDQYKAPIDKEFFDYMIDTMEKIVIKSGGVAESVEDSGYVANVLLANSDLAKFLFLYSDKELNGDSDAFNIMSNKRMEYSLYDAFLSIYLTILRLYSCPLYKNPKTGEPIEAYDAFDGTTHMQILNRMLYCPEECKSTDTLTALNYNFLLAKVLINKYPRYAALRGSLPRLKEFMEAMYKDINSREDDFKKVNFKETDITFERIINNSSLIIKNMDNGDLSTLPRNMRDRNQLLAYCKTRELCVALIKVEKMYVRGCFFRNLVSTTFPSNEEIARSKKIERRRREEFEWAQKQKEDQRKKELQESKKIESEKIAKIHEEIKLKNALKKEELKKQKEAEKKAMEESAAKKSDEELKKENEEVQNEQFRCFCESECALKSKSKKSSKSKKNPQEVETKESVSSSESISSSGSVSSSESPEIPTYNLEDMFKTEGNNEVKMSVEDAAYTLYYEPSLFSNLEEKNDAATVKNIKKCVMEMIFSLHVGGTRCIMDKFGKKRVINMSGCGQAKVDLYKRYANKLDKFFGKGSEPVLYKFKVNCTKECRVAYFVDDKNKIIYVTDNIEHIDKGEKH